MGGRVPDPCRTSPCRGLRAAHRPRGQLGDVCAGVAQAGHFGKGWVTNGELTYPGGVKGPLPIVVMLHDSGLNDMNQTVVDQ
ncbi:hypothetical protein GCM10009576_046430 [Streptomyces rhizosphaericus]|uniref:Dienelactone hydrolase domain-containing protein n=2 Tax=Streptomyces rhizosphaericus TaxID=114699 RepID=A0ABN1PK70_9ACTN